eukprot:CAMPEP_0115348978 /NCGR_PEP_ID=MMETSP0270-20121206/95682_1 /TAXON_ID=71861 /ORGANISM="Scrippsiella trochoidea, Strain CCMP3099" /LENGTH=126 /DNA_ID=CAMNT_0002770963 /DNA_START=443 /DNA_END=819 /DNA_ORIENTATION=+
MLLSDPCLSTASQRTTPLALGPWIDDALSHLTSCPWHAAAVAARAAAAVAAATSCERSVEAFHRNKLAIAAAPEARGAVAADATLRSLSTGATAGAATGATLPMQRQLRTARSPRHRKFTEAAMLL